MRASTSIGKTLRQPPAGVTLPGLQLLIRAGYVRLAAKDALALLPFGQRMWQKLAEQFVVPTLPAVQLAGERDGLAELLPGWLAGSYRDLPIRVRLIPGLALFSLHPDADSLAREWGEITAVWSAALTRLLPGVRQLQSAAGLDWVWPHPAGDSPLFSCEQCGALAPADTAPFRLPPVAPAELTPVQRVATPDCETIAALADYLGVTADRTVKAVFCWWQPTPTAVGRLLFLLIRGDLTLSETKLMAALGGGVIRPATAAEIAAAGAVPGYASAVGLTAAADGAADSGADGVYILADHSLTHGTNFVTGANEAGFHLTGVNYPRDFEVTGWADLAQAVAGAGCTRCDGRLTAVSAFHLGTARQLPLDSTVSYVSESNQPLPVHRGWYELDADQLALLTAEQARDGDGLMLPESTAPFQVHLMTLGKGAAPAAAAEDVYVKLMATGTAVYYDDRPLSAGVKFKDADLIGLPWRVMISERTLAEGMAELKARRSDDRQLIPLPQLIPFLTAVGIAADSS